MRNLEILETKTQLENQIQSSRLKRQTEFQIRTIRVCVMLSVARVTNPELYRVKL